MLTLLLTLIMVTFLLLVFYFRPIAWRKSAMGPFNGLVLTDAQSVSSKSAISVKGIGTINFGIETNELPVIWFEKKGEIRWMRALISKDNHQFYHHPISKINFTGVETDGDGFRVDFHAFFGKTSAEGGFLYLDNQGFFKSYWVHW